MKKERFLHLERPRPAGDAAQPRPSARFDRISSPAPTPEPTPPDAEARFGEPAAAQSVALQTDAPEAQPFVRCARCGVDHQAAATLCRGCGAPLDTPLQREFNQRLWDRAQAEQKREALPDDERARRLLGIALAHKVASEARRGAIMDDLPWPWNGRRPPVALLLAAAVIAGIVAWVGLHSGR